MKFFNFLVLSTAAALLFSANGHSEEVTKAPKVAVVNFKKCVEDSNVGKAERENFDALRKQMESTLEQKEKSLTELTQKFNDPDYLDSLSPEAEEEAKNQYRNLSQEMAQLQQQYYQTLNQTNMKVVQKLADLVATASEKVAKEQGIDLVLNEESSFFYVSTMDISDAIIKSMDEK